MPSNAILESKKQIVSELVSELKEAQAFLFADYRGLTVEQDTELRNALRAADVKYKIVKNTLTKIALKELGIEGLDETLKGPSALAYSTSDVIAPAKIINEFSKKTDGVIEMKAGAVEGKVVDLDELKALAETPSKETLLAQLCYSVNYPLTSLAVALNAVAEKMAEGGEVVAEEPAAEVAVEEPVAEAVAEEPAAEPVAEEPAAE